MCTARTKKCCRCTQGATILLENGSNLLPLKTCVLVELRKHPPERIQLTQYVHEMHPAYATPTQQTAMSKLPLMSCLPVLFLYVTPEALSKLYNVIL